MNNHDNQIDKINEIEFLQLLLIFPILYDLMALRSLYFWI